MSAINLVSIDQDGSMILHAIPPVAMGDCRVAGGKLLQQYKSSSDLVAEADYYFGPMLLKRAISLISGGNYYIGQLPQFNVLRPSGLDVACPTPVQNNISTPELNPDQDQIINRSNKVLDAVLQNAMEVSQLITTKDNKLKQKTTKDQNNYGLGNSEKTIKSEQKATEKDPQTGTGTNPGTSRNQSRGRNRDQTRDQNRERPSSSTYIAGSRIRKRA